MRKGRRKPFGPIIPKAKRARSSLRAFRSKRNSRIFLYKNKDQVQENSLRFRGELFFSFRADVVVEESLEDRVVVNGGLIVILVIISFIGLVVAFGNALERFDFAEIPDDVFREAIEEGVIPRAIPIGRFDRAGGAIRVDLERVVHIDIRIFDHIAGPAKLERGDAAGLKAELGAARSGQAIFDFERAPLGLGGFAIVIVMKPWHVAIDQIAFGMGGLIVFFEEVIREVRAVGAAVADEADDRVVESAYGRGVGHQLLELQNIKIKHVRNADPCLHPSFEGFGLGAPAIIFARPLPLVFYGAVLEDGDALVA